MQHPGCKVPEVLLLGLLLFAAMSCDSRGPAIVVRIAPVPQEAVSLQTLSVVNGVMSKEVHELDVSRFAGSQEYSFAAVMPSGAEGKVSVWVAARDQKGCVFATGGAETEVRAVDIQAVVKFSLWLLPETDKDVKCSGQTPLILGVDRPVILASDKDGTPVHVRGWGFHPRASILWRGTRPETIEWISPVEIFACCFPRPEGILLGAVDATELVVSDPDGAQDTRQDLLSYANDVLPLALRGTFPAGGSGPTSVGLGDLNGDGKLDLAVSTPVGVQVYMNQGEGVFPMTPSRFIMEWFVQSLVMTDVDGDGKLDLAFVGIKGGWSKSLAVLLNQGGGSFSDASVVSTGILTPFFDVGDLNRDGRADLVMVPMEGTLEVFLNQGGSTFTGKSYIPPRGVSPISGPAVTDFDGDGLPDVTVNSGGALYTYVNGGGGVLSQPPMLLDGVGGGLFLAVLDLNGDRLTDVATLEGGGVLLHLNQGGGVFSRAPSMYRLYNPTVYPLVAMDLTRDGLPELVTDSTVLLNRGGGMFLPLRYEAPTVEKGAPVFRGPFAIGDLNGDGKLDWAGTGSGALEVFFNTSL